ncbi:ImmA/IrrE family metallo-endopeptidase [Magnetospirillum sp. UT-4]|uniref:ImmA/IrrE family metallo-endopeptidase n=1 Tax=Magnetospirillum sp. UT-4 TaxID=2681467 RepID=UPI0013832C09|nr:ImmA/IrrE family metallo-endopeptidase [Magnetospirillum sp. UT-4]CAA7615785.1 conserved hypothetical protein [Magnetospirillum sp. UT-4]
MTLPTTPEGWAIHLSKLIKAFHAAHGLNRFPIKVAPIATEYSRQVFPESPITLVEGLALSEKFEGMLMPAPDGSGEWGIIYNKAITSKGRINFTLAHELGHYLLHRTLSPDGIRCTGRDMANWKSEFGQTEAQANTFASYLLMPLDDFREQVKGEDVSMDLMFHLADRYAVSLTAAILKWLQITNKRAMIVVAHDGFIDWSWSSDRLIKSGIFYRARQQTTALPERSLAGLRDASIDNLTGTVHPAGIWPGDEEVREMTLISQKNESSLSLLVYPDDAPDRRFAGAGDCDEPREWDTYDQFRWRG